MTRKNTSKKTTSLLAQRKNHPESLRLAETCGMWDTTKRLKKFSNLSLLPLPPAAPKLNPTEQVWQALRDEHLANRCYEDYDAIMIACCDAWNAFVDTSSRVKNLCSRSWAIL